MSAHHRRRRNHALARPSARARARIEAELAARDLEADLWLSRVLAIGTVGALSAIISRPNTSSRVLVAAIGASFQRSIAAAADGYFGPDGLTFTFGGGYRTLEQQRRLFLARFEPVSSPAAAGGRPCRFYAGGWWALKPGVALAATPGSSNHGWGLAIDAATGETPAAAEPVTVDPDGAGPLPPVLRWLLSPPGGPGAPFAYGAPTNAQSFGWVWEVQSEPWHLRYIAGDAVPTRVLEVERWLEAQR